MEPSIYVINICHICLNKNILTLRRLTTLEPLLFSSSAWIIKPTGGFQINNQFNAIETMLNQTSFNLWMVVIGFLLAIIGLILMVLGILITKSKEVHQYDFWDDIDNLLDK